MRALGAGLLIVATAAVAAVSAPVAASPPDRPGFVAPDADNSAHLQTDVNARQPDGSTALQWAVYDDDLPRVQKLLAAGADVAATNDYGATALSLAAEQGNAQIIHALLKAGANASAANAEGQTALMVVARTGNIEAAQMLLKAGANVNATEHWGGQTALMWAASQHQPQMLQLLLKHGAKPDTLSVVHNWDRKVTAEPREKSMDRGGFAALHYAAREGCVACIAVLVERRRGHQHP